MFLPCVGKGKKEKEKVLNFFCKKKGFWKLNLRKKVSEKFMMVQPFILKLKVCCSSVTHGISHILMEIK
jgi:hypothetical protein